MYTPALNSSFRLIIKPRQFHLPLPCSRLTSITWELLKSYDKGETSSCLLSVFEDTEVKTVLSYFWDSRLCGAAACRLQ
ncbi:hypothetical protein SKAU_G00081050 [Synaphobranchus kaupii]|uniref:Uncharacterized protein n=1 Tax=Synaphobranchus kaupii TaxID=118154 RepID=A0A9Q1FV47_SYNKA|nr:hypothetical protein SKAU_G00081050 [Synaphobranchus kaupii]